MIASSYYKILAVCNRTSMEELVTFGWSLQTSILFSSDTQRSQNHKFASTKINPRFSSEENSYIKNLHNV